MPLMLIYQAKYIEACIDHISLKYHRWTAHDRLDLLHYFLRAQATLKIRTVSRFSWQGGLWNPKTIQLFQRGLVQGMCGDSDLPPWTTLAPDEGCPLVGTPMSTGLGIWRRKTSEEEQRMWRLIIMYMLVVSTYTCREYTWRFTGKENLLSSSSICTQPG